MMRIVCGWCQRFMGVKPGEPGGETTSICDACATEQARKQDEREAAA